MVGQLLKDEVVEGEALFELAEAVTRDGVTNRSSGAVTAEQEMAA